MRAPASARRFSRRTVLRIAFYLAAALTLAFAVRFTLRAMSFMRHAGEPPAPWMPIGYVARLNAVDVDRLREALGLDPQVPDRRPIGAIAEEMGVPVEAFLADIAAAIEKLKSAPAQ